MAEYHKPATKADIQGFIDWLSTKPATHTYYSGRPNDCLITQFLKACGYQNAQTYVDTCTDDRGNYYDVPREIAYISYASNHFIRGDTYTYGSALFRAMQILQSMT